MGSLDLVLEFEHLLYVFSLSFYLVAGVLFYYEYRLDINDLFTSAYFFLKTAFILLIFLLFCRTVSYGYFPGFTFHETLLLFASLASFWLIVLSTFFSAMRKIIFLFIPVIIIPYLAAGFFPKGSIELQPQLGTAWLYFHIFFIFLAYATFSIAFIFSLIYLAVDFYLKNKQLDKLVVEGPTLEALDGAIYYLAAGGFIVLTVSIVLGGYGTFQMWGPIWSWELKQLWTLFTWFLYAAFLYMRILSGWRGRSVAIFNLAGYITIVFNYVFIRFFIDPGWHLFY